MSNLLWYKNGENWITPNFLSRKNNNYAEAIIYYKSKNKWVLLDKQKTFNNLSFDKLMSCNSLEDFNNLVMETYGSNLITNNIMTSSFNKSSYGIEIKREYISYSGGNAREFTENLLNNSEVLPIFTIKVKKPKSISIQLSANNGSGSPYYVSGMFTLEFMGNKSGEKYYPVVWSDWTTGNSGSSYILYSQIYRNNWTISSNLGTSNPTTHSFNLDVLNDLDKCFIANDDYYYMSIYNQPHSAYVTPIWLHHLELFY